MSGYSRVYGSPTHSGMCRINVYAVFISCKVLLARFIYVLAAEGESKYG
ncbi:MAG: hypothetical protein M3P47_07335 [Pseudomonadota bacterium]|nr:hypothetical protein [Pseudomonadota bacterium]